MPQLSDFISSNTGSGSGKFNLLAGAVINQNDAVQLGPYGRAFPVQVTDYAAVANCNYGTQQTNAATGQIVAQTQVESAQTGALCRQALLQGTDGSIYTFTQSASGLNITRYSAPGAVTDQVASVISVTGLNSPHMFFLSSGDIAVVAMNGSNQICYAIYDVNLNVVKALTTVSEAAYNIYFSACALSGGGFAIVYQQNANPLLSRLATYDNTGVVVLAPTTIWTRTGTNGYQFHRMSQLSNGNLAITVHSQNTVASIGLYHGVVTVAGASVAAFANLDTATTNNYTPELSVMAGFYCVAKGNGTNMQAFVFDNTGALQGAGFSAATTGSSTYNTLKLVNDGVAFYLIWARSTDSKEVLTKLPTTGTGYATTIVTTTSTQYNHYVDAFCENGLIVAVSQNTNSALPSMWVVNTTTRRLVSAAGTPFGSAPGTANGQYQRVIPGGDFSFICLYDYSNTAATNLCVGKYANTAVAGVALAAAAAGANVSLGGGAGAYVCNQLKGSASKSFDHTGTNLNGQKGTLLSYGAVMKGFI